MLKKRNLDFPIDELIALDKRRRELIFETQEIKHKKNNMQLFHICTKKEYEKNGEKKVKWYRVGFMKTADSGKRYIKLYQQPDTEFFVFDREERTQETETSQD